MQDQLYSYIKTASVKRWEFFSEDELRCKGTGDLDMDEEFMNPEMVEYFRQKLIAWRTELVQESNSTLLQLQEGGIVEADVADRASIETERSLELRTRDRARKLINKIDGGLERIEGGTYGFCEETDEPISL